MYTLNGCFGVKLYKNIAKFKNISYICDIKSYILKITLFINKKNSTKKIVRSVVLEDFWHMLQHNNQEYHIERFRRDYNYIFGKKDSWNDYYKIPQVCPNAQYSKNHKGEIAIKEYNGISVLKIDGLVNKLKIEEIKKKAAYCPQTLCAFTGADGRSVMIWTYCTLPDGSLPDNQHDADLFCVEAYMMSVKYYAPVLGAEITLEEPKIYRSHLLSIDDKAYVNPHPTPFIIEQPTDAHIRNIVANDERNATLNRAKMDGMSYLTCSDIFEHAYRLARTEMPEWHKDTHPSQPMIVRTAELCHNQGLPEEETVQQTIFHFYKLPETEIRQLVRSVYEQGETIESNIKMSRRLRVSLELPRFLKRRYEIRYNEVMQMTEFRPRQSIQFMFKELGRRELNTIHMQACQEGVDALFSEVDNLVHSHLIPIYNPITEYMDKLPEWDGKNRIEEVAHMVPNNNPYWERLFSQWFLSMVAHWMEDNNQYANATAPILIGEQGFRKSTFCRQLLPPELQSYFTDSIDLRSEAEAERMLSRFLLINIDEFDQLNSKKIAFIKHLFQKPNASMRRMFSETIGIQRRYASFIGTSNQQEVLRDPTGSRRYICIRVTAPIKVENAIDYRQLYAEAKCRILRGERSWLNDEDEKIIRKENKPFEIQTPLDILLEAKFCLPENDKDGEWMRVTDIMKVIMEQPGFNRKRDNDIRELGRSLKKMNFMDRRLSKGKLYFVKRL